MRRFPGPRRGESIGMFAGNPPLPQDPTTALVGRLMESLSGDAGLRLSYAGRRMHTGGGLTGVQVFTRPAGPNSEGDLQVAPVAINTRRAMSRFRGRP